MKQDSRRLHRRLRWKRLLLMLILLAGLLLGGFKLCQAVDYLFFTPLPGSVTMPAGMNSAPDDGRLNLLILGLDDPESGGSVHRSDSILLAAFDQPHKNVAVLAIPRDTLIKMPQRDTEEKINHAYAYGGAALARQAAADFLQVPVHFNLTLDSAAFQKIIDHFGGVSLHVENDMNYEDSWQGLIIHIKRGFQHMDGATAVKYVRFRNDELGDVGRVLRQQQLLKALANEVFSLSGLVKLASLPPLLEQTADSDLTLPFALRMLRSLNRYDKTAIRFETLPGEFVTIDDISYWQTDSAALAKLLDKMGIKPIAPQPVNERQ